MKRSNKNPTPNASTVKIHPSDGKTLSFCLLNKNFCNFPIARSAASAPAWQTMELKKIQKCHLHPDDNGEHRVILSLSKNDIANLPDLKRVPNRYDMDVLLRLSALTSLAQKQELHRRSFKAGNKALDKVKGTAREHSKSVGAGAYYVASTKSDVAGDVILEFRSIRALLECLGRNPDAVSNRESVKRSLQLWSKVMVTYSNWYEKGTRQKRRFDPFIEVLDIPSSGRGAVRIGLSRDYMLTVTRQSGYFAKIPLPLPLSSEAALNLACFLPTYHRMRCRGRTCPAHGFGDVCDRIGISGDTSSLLKKRLNRNLTAVNNHLRKAGSSKCYKIEPAGMHNIRFVDVSLDRKTKKSKVTQKSGGVRPMSSVNANSANTRSK